MTRAATNCVEAAGSARDARGVGGTGSTDFATTPYAHTPAGWLTLGFHEDLFEASMIALEAMLDLMNRQFGLSRQDSVALASLVVDLRLTQLVNAGVLGVHAILPHGARR